MRLSVSMWLLALCVVGACGSDPQSAASRPATGSVPALPSPTADPAPSTSPPATNVVDLPSSIDTGSLVIDPVVVSEPCPETDPGRTRDDGFAEAALTGDAAQALNTWLMDELAGRFRSIRRGLGPSVVVLCQGEEALADQLVEEFGDAVRVTVWDQAECQMEVIPEPALPDG